MNEQPPQDLNNEQDPTEDGPIPGTRIVTREQALAKYFADTTPETPKEQEARGLKMFEYYEAQIAAEDALMPERDELDEIEEQRERAVFLEEKLSLLEEGTLLSELFAIGTKEEALASPAREKAKADLIPIVRELKLLKVGGDVSQGQHDKFHRRYKNASRAVGIINADLVDHTR